MLDSLKSIILILFLLFLTVLLVFVGDKTLGLFGFPSEVPIRMAHPANFKEARKNIEFDYKFETNDQGLRYKNLPMTKGEGETRVFLLGDSFTEGLGVEASQTFVALLEQHFRNEPGYDMHFINGGMAGTGPFQYWRVFQNIGLKYDPDVVLVCLYANDISNMPDNLSRDDLYRRVDKQDRRGILKYLHQLFPRIYTILSKVRRELIYRSRTRVSDIVTSVSKKARKMGISEERIQHWNRALPDNLVDAANRGEFNASLLSIGLLQPRYYTDALDINTQIAEKKYNAIILVLNELLQKTSQERVKLAVLFIPTRFQYDPVAYQSTQPLIITGARFNKQWLSRESEFQVRIARWAADNSVPFLDLTPVFRQAIRFNSPLNWRLDGHWNANGHAVASRAIANWIEAQSVFGLFE